MVDCPTVSISPAPSALSYVVGTAISGISLSASGVTGVTYTYAVTSGALPAGVTLASGTPTTTVGSFPFVVSVTDGACSQTKNYTVVIACPTLVFGTNTATNAVLGISYTLNARATGNTTPLTYSVSPALPVGLVLNPTTGIISGTPTAITASASYVVTATQSVACLENKTYTFGVTPACSAVVLGLASQVAGLPNGNVDTPYSQTFTATGGTAGATYAFSTSTPLPTGLTLSASGVLSGTPKFSTSVTFKVVAISTPNACPGEKIYTLVIFPSTVTSIANSLENAVKVSPNPSSNDFNVDFGNINMVKSLVRVYDAQGKVVFTSENNANLMTISLGDFANGIYLLEVQTEKGRIIKRLSKN